MKLRPVKPDELHGGLSATGSLPLHIRVQAFCQCGWTGPTHPWDSAARAAERAELTAHMASSGHRPFPDSLPPPDGYHVACGHFHDLNDCCPLPVDSPAGRLRRITTGSTLGYPERALDRLAAVAGMQVWIAEEEAQAVIGARTAGCTWAHMCAAIGSDRGAATDRWGQLIARYEHAGLLPPGD
jgi:hypothetical protein